MNRWAVFRQDFAGNEFLVRKNLTEDEANCLVTEFESHQHHQHYWALEIPPDRNRLKNLFRQSIAAGSSLKQVIELLRNQGASEEKCNEMIAAAGLSIQSTSQSRSIE